MIIYCLLTLVCLVFKEQGCSVCRPEATLLI
jgi:hypothetical protein